MRKDTAGQYERHARSLLKRYRTETDHSWRDNPLAFVEWCGDLRPTWSRGTWRLYRAAIIWFMRENGPIEAVELAERLSTAPCHKGAKRRGKLPAEELRATIENLIDHRDELDLLAICLLYATQATGLRPRREWHGAMLRRYAHFWALLVQNAKYDEVRANGETRTLLLSLEMPKNDLHAIDYVLKKANSGSYEAWEQLYKRARDRLRRARPRGSRITFYDARHQFVANCKAEGLSTAEVAALLGHASDATANRHYGRKVHGNRRVYVNALVDEVATVRRRASANPFSASPRPRPAS